MKKLLVIRSSPGIEPNDLEIYLYDSGAIRSDYLDMDPLTTQEGVLRQTRWHLTSWDLAVKNDTTHHDWHIAWCGQHPYVFDDPYLLELSRWEKAFRGKDNNCHAVIHKTNVTYVHYQLTPEVSELLSTHIGTLLGALDDKSFSESVYRGLGFAPESAN